MAILVGKYLGSYTPTFFKDLVAPSRRKGDVDTQAIGFFDNIIDMVEILWVGF